IMARTLEIPAVVGSKTATSAIKHGEEIILDGMKGEVSINPDEAEKAHYKNLQKDFEKQLQEWAVLKDKASISKDGQDRKSTRLNSSHVSISYAVFCLKKKNSTRALN